MRYDKRPKTASAFCAPSRALSQRVTCHLHIIHEIKYRLPCNVVARQSRNVLYNKADVVGPSMRIMCGCLETFAMSRSRHRTSYRIVPGWNTHVGLSKCVRATPFAQLAYYFSLRLTPMTRVSCAGVGKVSRAQ